ncbi:MAG TPA: hypothetical protein VFC44_20580, partial [Candidatus Saccharimonadales bacterium]|nr:hypothetical protein [Candidatus Saccharimonadales bacterium]
MPLDQALLKGLSADEPTYLFIAGNLTNFSLPINAFIRFQNLLHKFDGLQTLPKDIHLSLNTDEWDFLAGAPLTVNGRQKPVFSSASDTGLECAFDYSIWINNPNTPVSVQTTFALPPGAFSIHFGFSTPENGDPFRLLIVNESNPPVPLSLPLQWLNTNGENLAASLQLPLGQLLSGQFILPPGCEWRLQPFIRTKSADKAAYLYKDWPAQALPRPWHELEFATAKHLLQEQLAPLKAEPGELALKMKQQTEQAGLDRPLGKFLGISDENLASFADFAPKPGPEDFINYLNRLRKKSKIKGWPRIAEEETDMGAEFQQIYERWVEKFPEARSELVVGNASYFSVVWQKLKEIDQTRQEQQRANNEVDELQRLLSDVPSTLDKVAYVGLFIIDPPKPSLEMIRFQTP